MSLRRRFVVFAAGLAAVAAVVAWWPPAHRLVFGGGGGDDRIVLNGDVEAHESVLSFSNVQAPITSLAFDEGRAVAAGTVLATLDDRVYQRQLGIDRAAQDAAEHQVEVALSQARASGQTVAADRLDAAQKRLDLSRDTAQLRVGAAAQQVVDQAATAAGEASATLARDMALEQVARRNVALARANAATARQKVALDRLTLSYTRLVAPFAGVIAVRQAEVGQFAAPGVPVFTLDDLDHVWVRAYLNEPDLGRVRLGQDAEVRTDDAPGRAFHGRLAFVSPQAEFTPKTVETRAQRVTLVYRVRIDVDNPTHTLLPGMPAEVRLAPVAAGR